MIYQPKYFILQELVPPSIFKELGEKAWGRLDSNMLRALDRLRAHFGPITVNNWHRGGPYTESGLRDPNTKTGAAKSAHKVGKAADCKPLQGSVEDMFAYILDNQKEFPEIRRLEDIDFTPTWLHFDVVEHGSPTIRVIKP